MPTTLGQTGITFPDETVQTTASSGGLIGYQVFTSSGTYTKATNNPTFVIVEVQGGGGGTTGSGGTSSFGAFCSATGGLAAGGGGTGSGGDINSTGNIGSYNTNGDGGVTASGGAGILLNYGYGATKTASPQYPATSSSVQGAGGGGYSMEKILASSLASSETVTVGAAGAGTVGYPAKAGLVIVWEYK